MKEIVHVFKVGGKIVEDESLLDTFLSQFAEVKGLKILVHGGGIMATRLASQLGVETQLIEGRRVTSSEMLDIATMVYAGLVNKKIVTKLQSLKVDALGLTGADLNLINSHKRFPTNGIDYGFVGDIDNVNVVRLKQLLKMNIVPVMSPLTYDGTNSLLNTNADTIANQLSIALSKDFFVNLVYCFEKQGVLLDENEENSVIPLLDTKNYDELLLSGAISGGMLPKLENAFSALKDGVKEVIITSYNNISNSAGGTHIKL